jgi:hypothetical protein
MEPRQLITAKQMDTMTPAERAEAVDVGTVHNLEELPVEFRNRIVAKAKSLEGRLDDRSVPSQ